MRTRGAGQFRISIVAKLTLVYTAILVPAIIGLSVRYYSIAAQQIHRQTEDYISDMLFQTCKNVEFRLEEFTNLAFTIQSDPTVQSYLTELRRAPGITYSNYALEMEMNRTITTKILYDDKIESVYIVAEDGRTTEMSKSISPYSVEWVDKARIYAHLGSPVWLESNRERQYLTLTAQINSLITQMPLGYLVINIREEYIHSIFSELSIYNAGEVVIVDSDLLVVSHQTPMLLGTQAPRHYRGIMQTGAANTFSIEELPDGTVSYVASRLLPKTGWRVLFAVPVAFYSSALDMVRNFIVIGAITVAAITTLLVLMAVKSLIRPAQQLASAMQRFGDGDFAVSFDVRTRDEIGVLGESFNSMVSNINDLVDHVYRQDLLKQQAELRSLRMQINPHFLYNVLETINWMSRMKGAAEIGSMAKALGELMRTSISGSDFVKVSDELRNINNYLFIQTFRYGDNLKTRLNVDEEIMDCYIPKLILQPIVENSIVHGIETKIEGGLITITGARDGDQVVLTVRDDGVGMEEQRLRQLLSAAEPDDREKEHIGIRNVDRRLKLHYGKEYGLRMESRLGEGTCAVIRFPAQTTLQPGGCRGTDDAAK